MAAWEVVNDTSQLEINWKRLAYGFREIYEMSNNYDIYCYNKLRTKDRDYSYKETSLRWPSFFIWVLATCSGVLYSPSKVE